MKKRNHQTFRKKSIKTRQISLIYRKESMSLFLEKWLLPYMRNRVHPSSFSFTKGSPFVPSKATIVNAGEGWVHPSEAQCLSAFRNQGER